MPQLRPHPDLDQLRRQARELLRAAQAEDDEARRRLHEAGASETLSGAQHALAREYGFESWPKMKAAVEGKLATPPSFVLRYVRSPEELRELWRVVLSIFSFEDDPRRWRFAKTFEDFERWRRIMLVVEHDGRIIGGTIGMNLIALEPWARGIGLGRRVWQTLEGESAAAGRGWGTHADPENKGFFLKLGYSEHGQSKRHMHKGVPLSPRIRELRTRRWRERAGDLESGVVLTPDPETGKIPPLAW